MKVTYELHALCEDRWSIVRVFDAESKEYALNVAHELYTEPHITDVKVVCETYKPESNEASERVIYDTTRGAGTQARLKKPAGAERSAPEPATNNLRADEDKQRPKKVQEPPKKAQQKPSSIIAVAVLGVVLVSVIAILAVVVSRGVEMLGNL